MTYALRSAWALARCTWLEAIRNRLLLVSVVFAVILVGLSVAAASVAIYEQARLIVDVGLAAVSGLGTVMAVALSVHGFAAELRSHTAFPPLARPLPRWAFVLGKYLGILAAMMVVTTIMALCTAAIVWLYDGGVPTAFWASVALNYVEMALVVAIALLFSTLAVPTLAATYSAGVLLGGNLSHEIAALAQRQIAHGRGSGTVTQIVYYVLPNLDALSARAQAANDLPVPWEYLGYGAVYGGAYTLVVLLMAMAVFSHRKVI